MHENSSKKQEIIIWKQGIQEIIVLDNDSEAVDSNFLYSLLPDYYFLLFACVFLLFLVFVVFVFTERPGRLGLLRRGH